MEAMTEKDFWRYLKPKLPGVWDRVENGAGVGMPDLSGCVAGDDAWAELKTDGYKKERPVEDLLRPSQRAWIFRRLRAGAKNIFVLVRRKMIIRMYHAGFADAGNGMRGLSFDSCGMWIVPADMHNFREQVGAVCRKCT